MSARFWVHRKEIITSKSPEKAPFFAWQCITIELKNRVIDLVIQDECCMWNFLKFLVWELDTLDGKRNTAKLVKEKILKDKGTTAKEV